MTSTFILGPGEEFVRCPYNVSHQITNARLITHLEKCRRSYLKELTVEGQRKDMKICRYNSLHHYPSPEIRFHEERCRDAFAVVRHMAYHNSEEGNRSYEKRRHQDDASHSGSSSSGPSTSSGRHETKPAAAAGQWDIEEEDWEADSAGYTPGYDPQQKLKSEVIIYNPSGLSKSERKKFRSDVKERAAEMNLTGEMVEMPTARTYDLKPDLDELKLKDLEREDRHPPSRNSEHRESSKSGNNHHASSSTNTSYNHSDKSKAGSSSAWYQKEKSEFSEDDFEGDDPYA